LQAADLNKALRQSSVMAAALANFIANETGANVLDSGGSANVAAIIANLVAAVGNASVSAMPPLKPQGRLTLTSGTPVIGSDVLSATVVYYTAFEGNAVPVYNGSLFLPMAFRSDLALSLASSASANAIVDVFAFANSGALTLGYGPVWANATPGAGSRGAGAGTTQLTRQNGLWVNAAMISLVNGANTYMGIPAGQATYLGSLAIDGSAGQVSCNVSFGQSRKWGVWNAYGRRPVILQAGDSTANWTYNTATFRASNNNSANFAAVFTGLAEEEALIYFTQQLKVVSISNIASNIGIGVNSTSTASGKQGSVGCYNNTTVADGVAALAQPASLGLNKFQCLEAGGGSAATTYLGSPTMLLTAAYSA
jgi:hypothetical protein